jgi:hypothetical protein
MRQPEAFCFSSHGKAVDRAMNRKKLISRQRAGKTSDSRASGVNPVLLIASVVWLYCAFSL